MTGGYVLVVGMIQVVKNYINMVINCLRAIKYNSMLISEFIQQLQDVYDEEGDMEIAIKIDDNDLGSEPIVVKSTVYEQLYIVKS